MRNNDERLAFNLILIGLFPLISTTLIIPWFGYFLLALVVLGIISLIGCGAFLWWNTRFVSLSDSKIKASRNARQSGQRLVHESGEAFLAWMDELYGRDAR